MKLYAMLILGVVLYTAFGLFTSKAGGKLNDNLVAAISNGLGVILPLTVYYIYKHKQNVAPTKEGIIYALLAGVCIAAFSVLLINLFAKAENVSFIMPVIYGGTIVLGSLVGLLFFKEHASPIAIIGLSLVTIGIGFIVYARLHA